MTPDVSGVGEAIRLHMASSPCVPTFAHKLGDCPYLQQAAEQACYRDRLATLERLIAAANHRGSVCMATRIMRKEIAEVQQLLAASA